MTNEEQDIGGHMVNEATKRGGIIKGGTIQFGAKGLPFSAIVVSLMDNPETVMSKVKEFEAAYSEAFGASNTNTPAAEPQAAQSPPEAIPDGVGVGFRVGPARWASSNRGPAHMTHKVSCTRCKGKPDANGKIWGAPMYGNEINGEFGARLAAQGIDEDAYMCIATLPDGSKCNNYVLYSHAVTLVA